MKVTVVIPARMAATRFPGKPLAKINHKPLIQWVYQRSQLADVDDVLVVTDSEEILTAVRQFGGAAQQTRADHANGTSRIAEIAETLDSDIIVNVQGDEPCIHPEVINEVIRPLRDDPALEMATMATPILAAQDVFNPNIVKVVTSGSGRALYFSRAPIPFVKHLGMKDSTFPIQAPGNHFKHIGIYAYRREFLLRYANHPPSELESLEGLEQLRALHMGAAIFVGVTQRESIGVDEPGDLEKAILFLEREGSVS